MTINWNDLPDQDNSIDFSKLPDQAPTAGIGKQVDFTQLPDKSVPSPVSDGNKGILDKIVSQIKEGYNALPNSVYTPVTPLGVKGTYELGQTSIPPLAKAKEGIKELIEKIPEGANVPVTPLLPGTPPVHMKPLLKAGVEATIPSTIGDVAGAIAGAAEVGSVADVAKIHPSVAWEVDEPPTKIVKALDSIQEEFRGLNQMVNGQTKVSNVKDAINTFAGAKGLGQFDADRVNTVIKDQIPSLGRRILMDLYNDLGGRVPTVNEMSSMADSLAEHKIDDLQPTIDALRGMADAGPQKLTPREKEVADLVKQHYGEVFDDLKNIGVITNERQEYASPGTYLPPEEYKKQGTFMSRILDAKTGFARQRQFPNAVVAIDAGYVPKTMDIADKLSIYQKSTSNAAASATFRGMLQKSGLINYEGQGVPVPKLDMPIVEYTSENTAKAKLLHAYMEPQDAQKVNNLLAERGVLDNPLIKGVEEVNKAGKKWGTMVSFFHWEALGMDALGKGINPVTGYAAGLDLVDKNPTVVRDMIRAGLHINNINDWQEEIVKGVQKVGGSGAAKFLEGVFADPLWQKYWPGLKIISTKVVTDRLIAKGVDPTRALEMAAADANNTFGGQNLTKMARSPVMQRLFQLVAFAADYTESKARSFVGMFGKGLAMELSPTEKKALMSEARTYWTRLTAWAIAAHVLHQTLPYTPDLATAGGFRDVHKAFKLMIGDPTYFTSKLSTVPRAGLDLMRNKGVGAAMLDVLPAPFWVKSMIQELGKAPTDSNGRKIKPLKMGTIKKI